MWATLATFVVGLLTVAAGTSLFTGWPTRARKSLREELELLGKVPKDFPGRETLAEYITEGIEVYVQRGRGATLIHLKQQQVGAWVLIAVSWLAAAAWLVYWWLADPSLTSGGWSAYGRWQIWTTGALTFPTYAGTVWLMSIRSRIRRRRREAERSR